MKSSGIASLSLLGTLLSTATVLAQQPLPPPPGGTDPGAQPPPAGAAPAPGQPAPAGAQPFGPPAGQPPAGAPGAAPPAGQQPGAGFDANASWSLGGGGEASASGEMTPPNDPEMERAWRRASLKIQNTLSASTGLLHVSEAGSGAPGTFRVSFITEYFKGSGFLCDGNCPTPAGGTPGASDEVTRIASHLGINATILPFLEGYVGFHASATDNDQGRPQLLQVLGDTSIGLKGFMPHNTDQIFSAGGEAQLWLLNGTGGVGLDGGGTSFALRGLATADLSNRSNPQDVIPLKMHLNLGYKFDNSGKLVTDVEDRRGSTITRIERFGLGINRTDSFQIGLGAEGTFEVIRPFLEYTMDVPVNRQNYTCNESRVFPGDGCLGNDAGFKTTPSRVTIGARAYPPLDGLSLLAALDIGTGATSSFIEEVAPQLPWNLYLGAAFAFDTKPPEPMVKEVEVEKLVEAPVAMDRYIAGTVVEKGTTTPVPNAIIRFEGRNLTGMVAGEDGAFRTINLDPGTYTFNVTAEGYHDGQCSGTIQAAGMAGAPAYGSTPPGYSAPAYGQPGGAPPGPYTPPGGAPPGPYTPPAAGGAQAPSIVTIQCELEALPKVGNIQGSLMDAASNQPVGNAKVKITDKLNRELELSADASGTFRFENVPPGAAKISVDAPGYFGSVTELEVKPREDLKATISLNKRPKTPNVVVAAKEVKLRKQVHFAHDSAQIEPDSEALLEEIADVMKKREDIQKLEIQGHTDNTGSPVYNQRLSQQRAAAVRDALVKLGVDSGRLEAKGYGQDKPLVPNVSAANRARNRRVQLMILEKGK
ncbi:MAG: OmpA family protein [Polyangiaceae bacterium]|nr:OmpA family protein [Polyangiaceae bacterium]